MSESPGLVQHGKGVLSRDGSIRICTLTTPDMTSTVMRLERITRRQRVAHVTLYPGC
jgi:hypothetical protein